MLVLVLVLLVLVLGLVLRERQALPLRRQLRLATRRDKQRDGAAFDGKRDRLVSGRVARVKCENAMQCRHRAAGSHAADVIANAANTAAANSGREGSGVE